MNIAQHPPPELLSDYLADSLDASTEFECDQHFERCAKCCSELAQLCNVDESFESRLREIHSTATIGQSSGTTYFDFARSGNRDTAISVEDHDAIPIDPDGRYEFKTEVARGGMGVVYSGRDTLLDRGLVLKVLHPKAGKSSEAIERFVSEAKINGNLQHPGIVPIHDLGQLSDDRPFFSMKRIEGHSLDAILAERSHAANDQVRLLNVLTQVCQTVAYAHSQGIVHRDLKPQNIMVGRFGEVQVVDWGIAKKLNEIDTSANSKPERHNGESANHSTRFGQVLGTPTYMAPEQATADAFRIDKRTDVFALGAILYEVLTGRQIYPSTGDVSKAIEFAATCDLAEAFDYLDSFNIDRELADFCKQCLSTEPELRPSDANCVAKAIIDHGESNSQRLRRAELFAERQRVAYEEKNKRRMIVWGSAVAIALLCSLITVGYAFFSARTTHLASSLSQNLDAYHRTIELAAIYPQAELTAMVEAFDVVEAVRSSRHEIASHPSSRQLSQSDVEFCRRLMDAHIWKVADADDPIRTRCLTEASRAYETTFSVFTDLMTSKTNSQSRSADAILAHPPFVQQVIVNAIDDYMLLGKRTAMASADQDDTPHVKNWERIVGITEKVDSNELRSDIRRGIRELNRTKLEDHAARIDLANASPATIYLLVEGLQLVGAGETASTILDAARTVHPNAFWLNGRIVPSDRAMPPRPSELNQKWDSSSEDHDVVEVVFSARENMRAKRYDVALQQFQWVFRDVEETTETLDPRLDGPRLATVIKFWSELGQRNAAAAHELVQLGKRSEDLTTDVEMQGTKRVEAFRVFAAIHRVLDQPDRVTKLFAELAESGDTICHDLFKNAEPELAAAASPLLRKYSPDYSQSVRNIPRLAAVTPTPAMGNARDQFATVVTLIAMLKRTGHHADAIAIADDARLFWPDDASVSEINEALDGHLPPEARQKP